MKTIFVTGGAGFIGSHFVESLLASGRQIVVLDALTYAGSWKNLFEGERKENVERIEGRIENRKLIRSLLEKYKPEWVVNFAAETHVDNSIARPYDFIQTNIVGVYSLLAEALHFWNQSHSPSEFRFLQVSTDEVFGTLGNEGAFDESSPYQPNSPYSASKAAADHLVRSWHHTYRLPTLISHCSNNYGPKQFSEKLIPLVIKNALLEKPLPVYGDGKQIRDWIHVQDHCKGLMLCLEKGKVGQNYCFGGNNEWTNINLVRKICQILNYLKPRHQDSYEDLITYVKDRPGHDFRYAIDNQKAIRELGFTPTVNFSQGLEQTIRWFLDQSELEQSYSQGA